MFGKKKPQPVCRLLLCGEADRPLFDDALTELRFPEELILAKSVEFFSDPAPCYIHRGAVTVRLLEELRLACRELEGLDTPVCLSELDASVRSYLDAYPGARTLRMREEPV